MEFRLWKRAIFFYGSQTRLMKFLLKRDSGFLVRARTLNICTLSSMVPLLTWPRNTEEGVTTRPKLDPLLVLNLILQMLFKMELAITSQINLSFQTKRLSQNFCTHCTTKQWQVERQQFWDSRFKICSRWNGSSPKQRINFIKLCETCINWLL